MFSRHKMLTGLLLCSALLAACATSSSRQSTAQQLTTIIAGDQRSEANRARDAYRHPKETLLFFGIRPEMTVLEVWPEPGWYTEIIAPLLREKGKYYAAVLAGRPGQRLQHQAARGLRRQACRAPGPVRQGERGHPARRRQRRRARRHARHGRDLPQPAQLDGATATPRRPSPRCTARSSPAACLGVVEHRGNQDVAQDPKAKSGYVNEDYAIKLIEAQGFRLVGTSQVNDNPKDTKDYAQGVWTLPPTYTLGDKDRAKYAAIGESDRFTLLFQKPRK